MELDSPTKDNRGPKTIETDSDTDFQARGEESDGEESVEDMAENISVGTPEQKSRNRSTILGPDASKENIFFFHEPYLSQLSSSVFSTCQGGPFTSPIL